MLEQYSTNYCICQEDIAFFRGSGGCFMGRLVFAVPVPGGGRTFFVACRPCLLLSFLPPIPPPPSPAGKGDQGYFMQGASPLASPGLNPGGAGLRRLPHPAGGLPPALPVDPAAVVLAWAACLLGRLPTLPLVLILPPIPPTPFPGGEGGDSRLFHARGFAPCIPATEPARHRFALPLWCLKGGLAPFVARLPCL